MNNIVFILGLSQRTGTNFLTKILLTHPYCRRGRVAPEDYLVAKSNYLDDYIEAVFSQWSERWFKDGAIKYDRFSMHSYLLQSIGKGLLLGIAGNDTDKTYITKTPSTELLNNFFRLFPEQKLIILVRYGKDQVESAVKSFERHDYTLAMEYYALSADRIVNFLSQWQDKKEQILLVHYENLFRHTELEANRIFAFMGLNPQLVSSQQLNSLPILGSSTNRGNKKELHWQPIYDKSQFDPLSRSSHWSKKLHRQFETICGTVSHQLGYERNSNLPNFLPPPITPFHPKISLQTKKLNSTTNSLAQTTKEIVKESARKFWFALGENDSTQSLYRRLLKSATKVKWDIIAPEIDYYSSTRNDRWIVEYVFPSKQQGIFLEVGAKNGRDDSSCYVLETQLAWRGICVEPQFNLFTELEQNRSNSLCEYAHLGIKQNLVTNSQLPMTSDKTISLEELLEKYNAPNIIDYASFHLDGNEYGVLKSFAFDRYTFLALSLKCDESCRQPITDLLTSKGYQEVKNPFNQKKPWERYWLHHSIHKTF